MKRILLLSMLFILAIVTASAQKTYVLLLGVQNYDNPSYHQNNLTNTVKDCKSLRKIFTKAGAECAIVTGKNVTRENVNYKVSQMVSLANSNPDRDNIIVYFSGHGGDDVMCLWDGDYPYRDLFARLAKARAKNIYIFVDACRSGSAGSLMRNASPDAVNPRMALLSATRANENSIDDPYGFIGQGWYTQALIKALRGLCDTNHDKQLSLTEIFKYVYNDVTARGNNLSRKVGADITFHPQLFASSSQQNSIVLKW